MLDKEVTSLGTGIRKLAGWPEGTAQARVGKVMDIPMAVVVFIVVFGGALLFGWWMQGAAGPR